MNFNRIRRRVWMTSYWGQYFIVAYLLTGPLALFTTEGSEYGTEAWTTGDWFVLTWIFGVFGTLAALANLVDSKNYMNNLNRYSHLQEKWIEAQANEATGKLDVYEKTRTINGETSYKMCAFDPENELEECLDFVNDRRASIESKKIELAPAKQVAKLINEGK